MTENRTDKVQTEINWLFLSLFFCIMWSGCVMIVSQTLAKSRYNGTLRIHKRNISKVQSCETKDQVKEKWKIYRKTSLTMKGIERSRIQHFKHNSEQGQSCDNDQAARQSLNTQQGLMGKRGTSRRETPFWNTIKTEHDMQCDTVAWCADCMCVNT